MSDEDGRKSHRCVDCHARSPETNTNYTLISARYGWRLTRRFEADGTPVIEWRCPRCWERFKKAMPAGRGETVPPRPDAGASDRPPPTTMPPSPPKRR